MGHAVKILIFLFMCHFTAYYVLSKLTPYRDKLKQYLIACTITIAVTLLSRSVILGYICTLFVCLHFGSKATPEERIALFFAQAFAITFTIGFKLNPGINLGGLSHQRILFLALLLPLLLFERREPSFSKFNAIDKAVVFYVFWVIVCNFRIENYTAMFRTDLWEVIDVFVPYLAIRYFTKNYALVLTAVSFALLSQSLAGIVESVMHWHLYSDLERFGHFANQLHPGYKFRNGFLRAQTSFMNPLIYALFSNMSFCCSVIFLSKIGSIAKENYSKKFAWAGFLISTLGTMASGSRAGMAGSVLIVIVSMILLWAIKRSRDPKQLLITSFVCCIALVVLFGQDFLNENFDYRMRLLKIGSGVVMDSPLFGHMDARSHPAMQELIQGEGIVDVVNSYLAIALSYGLPALILFVFAVLSCLSKLYDCLRLGNDDLLAFGIFAFASIFILAFNLITTSASHWTGQWMWIALAIGSNIIARAKDEEPLTIAKRQ